MLNRRDFMLGAASLAASAAKAVTMPERAGDPLVIAHCCDPQFGMGKPRDGGRITAEGYANDLRRCEAEIEIINSIKPDLAFFAGDMTHLADDVTRDWPRLLGKLKVPFLVSPGNHDVGNSLVGKWADRFVSVFGSEYCARTVKGWRFIAGNSQYWFPTKETQRAGAYQEWLDAELADCRRSGAKMIFGTHYPLFRTSISEEDVSYAECHRKEGRAEAFNDALGAGCRFWLSGHTHRLGVRAQQGLVLLNAETTCDNFDGRPFGFRLLKVWPDGNYTWDFVPVMATAAAGQPRQ